MGELLFQVRNLLFAAFVFAVHLMAGATGVDVLSSRNDDGRTGANLREGHLTVARVRNSFGKLGAFSLTFDGKVGGHVYAQPLYISNVIVPGRGATNVLLVATTNNFVFAFDADRYSQSSPSSSVLWKVNLGPPPSMEDVWELGQCERDDRHCILRSKNIEGNVGVMSTPAIDLPNKTIFISSRVKLQNPARIIYRLHALNLGDGREQLGSPYEINEHFDLFTGVRFNPAVQNQRPGLAISGRNVIVAFGAHEDLMPYRGWAMSFRYQRGFGFSQTGAFVTTPDGSTSRFCAGLAPIGKKIGDVEFDNLANECAHGGIWMSGRAPAVDSRGNILLMVGNGKNDRSISTRRNFGNSLVKLDPVSMAVIDFFTPENHIYLNDADLDLGGSGPMLIPRSDLIVGGGKEGFMYVWSEPGLGQFRPGDPFVHQKIPVGQMHRHHDRSVDHPGGPTVAQNNTPHPGHIMGGPVYWTRPPTDGNSILYNWGEGAELRAYRVDPTRLPPIDPNPMAQGMEIQEGHPGGILALSANGSKLGTGIVWANTYDAGQFNVWLGKIPGALISVRPGILRAYDAESVEQLWASDNLSSDRLGSFAKFTPPTVANGRVYMATFSNEIVVYGLLGFRYPLPGTSSIAQLVDLALLGDDDTLPPHVPAIRQLLLLGEDE